MLQKRNLTYLILAFPNEPILAKWTGSSFDDTDLFEQRLADCTNDFSDPAAEAK